MKYAAYTLYTHRKNVQGTDDTETDKGETL